jgi:glutathione peroxidase
MRMRALCDTPCWTLPAGLPRLSDRTSWKTSAPGLAGTRPNPLQGIPMTQVYDFKATTIDGDEQSLADYKGKTMLIVNVASKCGFTPQYKGLEDLYEKFRDQGLVVLGFPCDQFGHQEPGDEEEIKNFCSLNYDVQFPLFAKIEVNGANAHPLYRYLKGEAKGLLGSEAIKWNFTKFLVDKDGKVVRRFAPTDTPKGIEKDVAAAL